MRLDSPLSGQPTLLSRRRFLAGASVLGLGVAAYAGTHARHELEVTERTLAVRNLPDAFQGLRFVQISDIHLTEFTEPWYLETVIQRVNQLHPELVLLTGDFISHGPASLQAAWHAAGVGAEIISGLKAPQRFAILGNHDLAVGPSKVVDPMKAHGTPFLINSYVPIERGQDRIWLGGLDDISSGVPDLNLAVPPDPRAPVILLCHEPDYADPVTRHPRFPAIDAMLSGHTHGGQMRLPFLGPLILPPLGKHYVSGFYRFQHMQLYVNRGIGTVGLPFRLNCPSEITHFTLQRA